MMAGVHRGGEAYLEWARIMLQRKILTGTLCC